MAEVAYPKKDRKTNTIPVKNWDLNASGLYAFKVCVAADDGSVSIAQTHPRFGEFTLPINPTNLQISTPFAITATATSGGVLEEHNGSVFRNISISGSFGIAPGLLRNVMPKRAVDSAIANVGAATGGLAVNTLGSVNNIASAISRTSAAGKLAGIISGIKDENLTELGFYKINELGNYLVSYAEFKKTAEGATARLLFVDRKNGVNYVVTPISFDMTKDAGEPHLVKYRVSLKAWDLATAFPFSKTNKDPDISGPTALARALNVLREARSVLAATADLQKSIIADYDNVIKTINEVGLLLKDITGVAKSFADIDEIASQKYQELAKVSNALRAQTLQITGLDATNPSGRGVSSNGQLLDNSNPLRAPIQRLKLVDQLDAISLNAVNLSSGDLSRINDKINKARSITISDLDARRTILEAARDDYADAVGLGDATYNATRNRSAGVQLRAATSTDYKTLQALGSLIGVIDTLYGEQDTSTRVSDPFIRAQSNANGSLDITSYNNGFPVPFPHQGSLEQLALTYLGDANKATDIVIANGLKPPYVDEDGFERLFTANGTDRQFTVNDITNLYPGQEVFLSSTSVLSTRRLILETRDLGSSNYLIIVDGDPTLANYKTAHSAKLTSYLPNTVNSSKMITIPTNKPIDLKIPKGRALPISERLDRQQKAMGIDFALTEGFDLALSNNNDLKLSAGVANALQAVKIKLGLEKGSLKQHPEVGLGLQVGTSQSR
jgi:hypothetical protein